MRADIGMRGWIGAAIKVGAVIATSVYIRGPYASAASKYYSKMLAVKRVKLT